MPTTLRRAVSINYHFLRETDTGRFKLRAHEKPERFSRQLESLAKRFAFCRGRDLADPRSDLPASTVLLTFDDGARDVASVAVPLLQRYGATATMFVCTQPYIEGRLLDIQKIEFLMYELGLERFRRAFYAELKNQFGHGLERESLDFAGGYRFYRYDDEATRQFKLDLNYQLPYANVSPVLDALFAKVFGEGSERDAVLETYMSVDDLKRLVDGGFEVGTHTHRHRALPRLDFEGQKREIETSVSFLREITGQRDLSIAYPFGFHDEATIRAAEEVGLLAGFVGGRRLITDRDLRNRWTIPRYDVNDCFDKSNALAASVFSPLDQEGGARGRP